MSLADVLRRIRLDPEYARCITAWRELPPRPARYADYPEGIEPALFRKIQSSAEDRAAAKELEADRPLLKAFLEADEKLGLQPVKLRHREEQNPPDTEDEPAADAEGQ